MGPKKIAIIGGGPAGLSCAYNLSLLDYEVHVFEASESVGGLAKSFPLWGQTVDVGPHRFFSSSAVINSFWRQFIPGEFSWVKRVTRIFYKGKYFQYPLEPLSALVKLGPLEMVRCFLSYALAKLFPIPNPDNFQEWMINRFGKRLFEIFFKNYSEKLWGLPTDQIDKDWAAQRIKNFSLGEALRSVFRKVKTNHRTLVDRFMYPSGGAGKVYQRMHQQILKHGGTIHFKKAVVSLSHTGVQAGLSHPKTECLLEFADGSHFRADQVVSTMPLTHLIQSLDQVPQEVADATASLRFRNTILVYLECDAENLFSDNWIDLQCPSIKSGRVTNFRNWCPSLYDDKKTSILCVESWCFSKDAVWNATDEELSKNAAAEIRQIGLLPKDVAVLNQKVVRIPQSYPLYEVGYSKKLQTVKEYLDKTPNLIAIGRNGAFKYNNQDHSILMGILAAAQVHSGKKMDLWGVNSDSEYQEGKLASQLLSPLVVPEQPKAA